MITRDEVNGLLLMMKSAFPNFHPDLGTPSVFEQLLNDLELDEIRAAVIACCSEPGRAFAPSVGEIRGAAMDLRKQSRGVPSALEAWGEVHRQIIMTGHTGTPQFSNPLIGNLVRRFGWNNLCMSENEMVDRAHFIKAYDLAVEEELRYEMQPPMIKAYIEQASGRLNPPEQIKQLADKLGGRK